MTGFLPFVWRSTARIAACASLAATLTAQVAVAVAGQAPYYLGEHKAKITTPGFDFGGDLHLAGTPTVPAKIEWNYFGHLLSARIFGYLYMRDVGGLCSRLRLDGYAGGGVLVSTDYSLVQCAPDDKVQAKPVTMSIADDKLDEVRLTIEKKTAIGGWEAVASERYSIDRIVERIRITARGFDFGSDGFLAGAPTGSGVLTWTRTGGQVTPHLTGTLHINDAASACARMRIEYYDRTDTRLADHPGGKVCAPDNAHHEWNVDLKPFSDAALSWVRISIQSLGTDQRWRTVGSAIGRYTLLCPPSGCVPPRIFD